MTDVVPTEASSHAGPESPAVSIVLPAYNVERYLVDTVDGVLAQTLSSWELLIVDDGSSDATGSVADAVARTDERITVLHQRNGGVSRARNAGWRSTNQSSAAVIFLDADDVWEPDALALLSEALDREPDAVAVYGFTQVSYADREPQDVSLDDARGRARHAVRGRRRVRIPVHAPASFEVLCVWSCIVTGGQLLIRRSAIHEREPFVVDILSQDWLFWLRLSLRGDVLPIDAFVLRKLERGESLMRSRGFGEEEMIIRRRLIELPEMTGALVQTARACHRLAPLERLSWAWTSLCRGEVIQSLKHVRHALLAGRDYLRMRKEYVARVRVLEAREATSAATPARHP